ncbi:hypothetical protein [Ruminococcus sp. FC2018]|uniref:hypothetical protein n=1 Tax=Ruminococcus sp. FC2018 TaxID=1410617 RepID=UPI00048D9951|nr:hypothetical protein [Ruminococcus sp. FC2018]
MSKTDKTSKKSQKTNKAHREPIWVNALRLLMAVVCLYSVVFWGSVTLVATLSGQYSDFPPPAWVTAAIGLGGTVILCSAALALWGRYIIAFAVNCAGTAAYLAAAGWFVRTIRHELDNRAVSADLLDMDKEYALRFYPAAAASVILLVLAVLSLVRIAGKKRKKRIEKESAPVKSIID